jgi:hypothetical protein
MSPSPLLPPVNYRFVVGNFFDLFVRLSGCPGFIEPRCLFTGAAVSDLLVRQAGETDVSQSPIVATQT